MGVSSQLTLTEDLWLQMESEMVEDQNASSLIAETVAMVAEQVEPIVMENAKVLMKNASEVVPNVVENVPIKPYSLTLEESSVWHPFWDLRDTRFVGGGHSIFAGFLNMGNHVIMYFYYLLAAFRHAVQKHLWWKKYLTSMQLVQFVLVFIHAMVPIFYDCNFPKIFSYVILSHGACSLSSSQTSTSSLTQ